MLRPMLFPRVEQRYGASTLGIDRCEIRALVSIAEVACERKITQNAFAAMLTSDDVIDVKSEESVIGL